MQPVKKNMSTDPLPTDTELLLLRLDLKTERLLAEVEALIIAIANRQALEAAQLDREDNGKSLLQRD